LPDDPSQLFAEFSFRTSLDFSEFDSEIQRFEEEKRTEILNRERVNAQLVERNRQLVQGENDPLKPLPNQIGTSLEFHSSVVSAYAKAHQINKKQQFLSKKINRRRIRQSKKSQEANERLQSKRERVGIKQGTRRKAKY